MSAYPELRCAATINPDNLLKIDAETARSIRTFFEGKEMALSIKINTPKRSLNQNNWYWGCIVEHVFQGLRDSGEPLHAEMQAHERLKLECNSVEIVNEKTGEVRKYPKSSVMNKSEFFEYCERCRQWAVENLGIDIPDPISQLTEPE